jgi:hypothetical protein
LLLDDFTESATAGIGARVELSRLFRKAFLYAPLGSNSSAIALPSKHAAFAPAFSNSNVKPFQLLWFLSALVP